MKQALIDLGSNTIKLAVYEVIGETFSCIRYESRYGYIVKYVKEDVLTQQGIETIQSILHEFQEIALFYECKAENNTLVCFSTASLRYIKNIQEVIKCINKTNSIIIKPISGEEEAECNFLAMRCVSSLKSFFGADMGGGSMQLFSCEENRLNGYQSFPIGSLKLARDFVAKTLPTQTEAEEIKRYVKSQLLKAELTKKENQPLLLMGGTMRLIVSLLGSNTFSQQELEQTITNFLHDPNDAKNRICNINPQRLISVIPGMICLDTVAQFYEIEQLRLIEASVREGYLLKYILNNTNELVL